ncbi:MAG: YHYH protein [Planctomycetota bacterium]
MPRPRLLAAAPLLLLPLQPLNAHPTHEHGDEHAHPTSPIVFTHNASRTKPQATITTTNTHRILIANGIPDHATGQFPNRGNPNRISAQSYQFRMALKPTEYKTVEAFRGYLFGVALNGVPFDPSTAEFYDPDSRRKVSRQRNNWNYEALSGTINLGLDRSNAHVQPTGAYHYHGIPVGLLKAEAEPQQMTLLGYAADGFPIYGPIAHQDPNDPNSPLINLKPSYQLKPGQRPAGHNNPPGKYDGTFTADWQYIEGLGHLDEANGRNGVTPEYQDGTYYYVLTDTFPFIPRNFRGEPDPSFRKGRGGGERRGGPPDRR